ncbi:MAG: alpha/beta fold hydrolase [Betaproteobacteria bacterium]|nr:alpha/beta fold hydrolase [Betaproteobacteria bacterium]
MGRFDKLVGGIATSGLRIDKPGCQTPTLVFLHGGIPGRTPYASSAHLWGACLEQFARERNVLALDLPGAGATGIPASGLTVDSMIAHVRASLDALGIDRCHLIGHDLGGLIALALASEQPARIAAVSTVACVAAAPSGDMIENKTFAYPPPPLWSRHSQAWALERIAYSHHPIDTALLDACMEGAAGAPHRAAQALMSTAAGIDAFNMSLAQTKARFYETCRGTGLAMPVQVIWGSDDPLGTVDQALWLFRLVAGRQSATQFHLINRNGALPFREDPAAFQQIVAAFYDETG